MDQTEQKADISSVADAEVTSENQDLTMENQDLTMEKQDEENCQNQENKENLKEQEEMKKEDISEISIDEESSTLSEFTNMLRDANISGDYILKTSSFIFKHLKYAKPIFNIMNEHFPNQDAYKKLSFFYVAHETLKHSIGPLIESGFVEYFVSHINEWVHDFTEKITDIVECHEYCSALLLLIDLWAEINICTPQIYKELRAIVFEKLFLYGSNIGIAYYKELLQTELKITNEIMDKNEECRFLSQAEKCSREYAKMEEFIKSTKDTLILHRAKKSIDDEDNTNFKEIYSTIDEFRSKNFKYFEVEAKAILYLESLYESKRVYLEEMKEKSQLLDQFKETLSKFRARDGEVVS